MICISISKKGHEMELKCISINNAILFATLIKSQLMFRVRI